MTAAHAAVAFCIAAVAVLWVDAPAASAHALLLRSDPPDLCLLPGGESLPSDALPCRAGAVLPQSPSTVRLVFSEAVQPIGRGLRVIGPDGRRADQGAVGAAGSDLSVTVDARPSGTYRVVWSVVSPDTHPELGTMTFSVRRAGGVILEGTGAGGAGAASPAGGAAGWGTALGAVAHALHFAGYALGFGAFAAVWLISGPPPSGGPAIPQAVWGLTGAGIVLLLLAEPFSFAAESVALGAIGGGADPAVVGTVLDSSFGRVLAQRLGAAILLWVLAAAVRGGAPRAAWTVLLLGAGLAFVDGQAAHATGVRPLWWGLIVNAAHLAAMGLWAGMLAFIVSSRGAGPARPSDVHRFVAAAAVAAVGTGIVMAAEHLAALRDFIATPYGRTLAVKAVAAGAVGGLGWLAARRDPATRLHSWEAAAMVAVLVLAGWLVLLRPPVP
ncbi:MAG TPA: copper resistance protein CopC [bacterium]|nr:copper resistance protein CopC [bacterium]